MLAWISSTKEYDWILSVFFPWLIVMFICGWALLIVQIKMSRPDCIIRKTIEKTGNEEPPPPSRLYAKSDYPAINPLLRHADGAKTATSYSSRTSGP